MFDFHSTNILEVNGSPQAPVAPVLSILAGEDINALTWNSPYFTDFFRIYWSNKPFESIDEPGVHMIDDPATPGASPAISVSYDHNIPSVFSLAVLYYRVSAFNANGETLSNQVDSYNFRLAIYEAIYNKTLEELTLRFTPELRTQYQDSKLWRSFVQSLCSELAQGRFGIKEALKQLNIQKAVDIFLNLWNNITGIARINVPVPDSTTNEITPETDDQYRQRLLDSVFWDKISNLALKKTMLLNLGHDASIVDQGLSPQFFREPPELQVKKYESTFGNRFLPMGTAPGSLLAIHGDMPLSLLRQGPNSQATVYSDTGTEDSAGTMTYTDYIHAPYGMPYQSVYAILQVRSLGSDLLYFFANVSGQTTPSADGLGPFTIDHGPIVMYLPGSVTGAVAADAPLTFTPSGATGTFVSSIDGVLTYELTPGSLLAAQWDWVRAPSALYPGSSASWLLLTTPELVTSDSITIRPKLLSNTYSVNLGVGTLGDDELNTIYDEISPLAALGNVLIQILQDVTASFDDWDITFGNIPYGPIFMQAPTQSGVKSTESNWSVSEEVILDNQRTMGDGETFYGNDGPDDIIILTRTV